MSEDFIPTRGSNAKSTNPLNFKAVVYESHKSKSQIRSRGLREESEDTGVNEFNIKRAKHEVVRFGMSGLDSARKEEVKIQLAVKLGAKPPRNKYTNYKTLLKEKMKQKSSDKSRLDLQQLGKNALGKSNVKTKIHGRGKKKGQGGLLDVYGKARMGDLKETIKRKRK